MDLFVGGLKRKKGNEKEKNRIEKKENPTKLEQEGLSRFVVLPEKKKTKVGQEQNVDSPKKKNIEKTSFSKTSKKCPKKIVSSFVC